MDQAKHARILVATNEMDLDKDDKAVHEKVYCE